MNSSIDTSPACPAPAARGQSKRKSFTKSVFYPHPPERVWVALTDPRALAEWLMPNNFKPQFGPFRFQTDPHPGCGNGITDCEVVEFDPPRRMVWLWTSQLRKGRPAAGPMRIEWDLSPEAGGTRLTLRQTGLEALPWYMRPMMTFGWGTMLKRWIPKVLSNVDASGAFTPGAIPLAKRCYKVNTVGGDMVY